MSDLEGALVAARARRQLPEPPVRRLLRERAGLGQADIAAALGVDRSTVCRWETGRRAPRGDLLVAYVQLLDRLLREGRSA